MAVKAQRKSPVTGAEAMVGTIAFAQTDVAPRGRVFVNGEIWDAVSDEPIRQGEEAQVEAVTGLTLKVAPHRTIRKGSV
jgi:membrane-bound serine protease (ClpP class)